jgi:hypothetical protein
MRPGSWTAACANAGVAIIIDSIVAALRILNPLITFASVH